MRTLVVSAMFLAVVISLPAGYWDTIDHPMPSATALLHSMPPHAREGTLGSYGLGSVADTLVPSNGTLLSGNYVPASPGIGYDLTGAAFDPDNGLTFVADQAVDMGSGPQYVSVVSPALDRVVSSVAVGEHPIGVTYDSACKCLYVTNMGSENVSIINGTSLRVVDSVSVGSDPWGIAFDNQTDNLYVANYGSNNVSVISGSTNQVIAWIGVSLNPTAVAYDYLNREVYVADAGNNEVAVIDTMTERVTKWVTVGATPDGLAFDPTNGDIYVANAGVTGPASGNWNVTIINGSTDTYAGGIWGFTAPQGIAYDSSNGDIYVVNQGNPINGLYGGGDVSVVDPRTNTPVASLDPQYFSHPVQIVFDSSNSNLYVTNFDTSSITVINGSANTFAGTITVATEPYGITFASSQGSFFVSNDLSNNLVAIQASTYHVVGWVGVGDDPEGLAYDNLSGNVYVTNNGGSDVSVVSSSEMTAVGTIDVGFWPFGSASDNGKGHVFISTMQNTSVIDTPVNAVVDWPQLGRSYFGGAAYDTANGYFYVASYPGTYENGSLIAINDSSFQVGSYMPIGEVPKGVAYDEANQLLYVANSESDTVSVVNASAARLVQTVGVGADPQGIAYDPVNGFLYVTDFASNQITVINGSSNQIVGSLEVGFSPLSDVIDPVDGFVLVTNYNSGTISIVDPYVTLPVLTSVSLAPSISAPVQTGGIEYFSANAQCNPGPCGSPVSYSWSTGNALGTLNSTTGSQVEFKAGPKAGTVILYLNGTLDSVTKGTSLSIPIVSKPAQGFLGLPGDEGYLLIGAVGAVAMAGAVFFLLRRRKSGVASSATGDETTKDTKTAEGESEGPSSKDEVGKAQSVGRNARPSVESERGVWVLVHGSDSR